MNNSFLYFPFMGATRQAQPKTHKNENGSEKWEGKIREGEGVRRKGRRKEKKKEVKRKRNKERKREKRKRRVEGKKKRRKRKRKGDLEK